MTLKLHKTLWIMALALLTSSLAYAQGSTSGNLRGIILDDAGQALIGVNVIATHTPSGTSYGTVTDIDGFYNFANVRVGGPYTIAASYIGYADNMNRGIMVPLGQTVRYDLNMSEEAVTLDGIEVVASSGSLGENSGTGTQIGKETIENLPTLDRSLNDFTRLTPQAKQTFDGGFTIAGINNRYNAIYIDGAVNNDVYGLSPTGTNGGQTGISPVSIDIIDQIQVVISPYDVSLGGFAGGGINAVTKSGSNNFEGTAYYFTKNENLAGKTPGLLGERIGISDVEAERLAEFSENTYGASIGGPIVKNKIFFFANAEVQDDKTPIPYNIETYEGDATAADLDNLRSFLQDTYGYDPGDYGDKANSLKGLKLFGKIDWNLNQNHRLTLRHQYTKSEQTQQYASSNRTINFANNGVFFPSTTNSSALELNSSFGTNKSNNLIIGYTTVLDDRDPIGMDFPYLDIEDGSGSIRIGSEQFSTANQLDQKVLTITDNFKIFKGNHTFTIGTHNEFSSLENLFIRQNFGVYEYDNIQQFLNGEQSSAFFRSYSLVDDITGDGSAASGAFNAMQLGFYVQDEIQINRRFQVTAGLRLDVPIISTNQELDESFQSTLESVAAQYPVAADVEIGKLPSGQLMFSPRLGFNYDLSGDRATILRGGAGIFTSRVPFVWPGGSFVNNGITTGGVFLGDGAVFNPNIQEQPTNPDFSVPSGQVDLFTKDFKYPQLFRSSLAVDHKFDGGWMATLEGMFSKTINNVAYTNVNSDPTVDFNWTNGADNRPVYTRTSIDPQYTAIYVGSNTSQGYTYNMTAAIAKEFANDLNISLAYTFGDAYSQLEGSSSQNSSQWRGGFHVNGRNDHAYGRSEFALGSRIVGTLNKKFNWTGNDDFSTSISLFYNGESGNAYSYVYGSRSARNINNETGSTSRNRSLIYVPTDASDITLVDPSQWDALNEFIENDEYLNSHRGQYVEKNSNRTPFQHTLDIRFTQDLGLNVGGKTHKFQITFDVFNFGNMISRYLGTSYNNPFDYQLLDFEGYDTDGTTPMFSFSETELGNQRFDISSFRSRWRGRLGFRYIFR